MARRRTDDLIQPSPLGPGRWLVRPLGSVPLVFELPDDAARDRFLRWESAAPVAAVAGPALGALLGFVAYRVWPAWAGRVVAVVLAGVFPGCAIGIRMQVGRGRRVPAALWTGPDPTERFAAAEPGRQLFGLVAGCFMTVSSATVGILWLMR